MKKIAITAFAAVFAIAACSTPASTSPTAAPTITPIPSVRASTAATQAPATQAASAAPATSAQPATSAAAGNAAARKVDITATNTDYSITKLTVKPGEKLEFVIKNTGEEKHNLVGIGEGISLVSPDFDFGATTSWIWTAPNKPGLTFQLKCSYHTNIAPIVVTVQ